MSTFENFHGAAKQEGHTNASPNSVVGLPADAAHNYISEMLEELSKIAKDAQLKDLAALLDVTVTAVKINGRFL